MLRSEVEEYLRATADVEGWFFPIDAYLVGLLDALQKEMGVHGNLFEIGVHHGKSALLLARAAASGDVLGVCDVFEDQPANLDDSGEGSRELFLRNLRVFSVLSPERLRIFAKRSELLTREDTTTCRLFHIDGGHRPEDLIADLRVAARALAPAGVVVVDDVFNPSWPGVSEGFFRFMWEEPETFTPFLIGGNKVFLTRPAEAGRYRERLASDEVWTHAVGSAPFVRQAKQWLGHTVQVAARTVWADLDPLAAARQHLGPLTWRDRLRVVLGRMR